ncbi:MULTISPECIES: hypothetical protein [unclassified Sphingobacterium]|uniref:hypothetical protein n=1 Tax=unclassified Sphingobacterium TaxID=2609468 RepID=UPI000FA9AB4E|nr:MULTISPECIES: hypothetical protein [unclassified Sphingobacterium]MBB1644590.1 hypothetical protein [Sphingobacterium sp. UME9]MCS4168346.1 hypothetical protein [Sphingobacterium sp. BIGb0116]WET71129.1 MAG: hypothetical protein P0Y57_08610 [Sphingobacterium sp.]
MNVFFRYVVVLMLFLGGGLVKAQSADSLLVVDDIQFDVKEFHFDEGKNELVINLFATSYSTDPREYKMNTFSTQVLDQKKQPHFFSTIQMGNVLVKFEDKQNYLHYLLEEDKPVDIQVIVKDWKKTDKPVMIKLVFESSTEEGEFLEVPISLKK